MTSDKYICDVKITRCHPTAG